MMETHLNIYLVLLSQQVKLQCCERFLSDELCPHTHTFHLAVRHMWCCFNLSLVFRRSGLTLFYLFSTQTATPRKCVFWGAGAKRKLACTSVWVLCMWLYVRVCWGGDGSVSCPHWATCQGPLKALCAGGQWKEGSHWPSDKNLCGWRVCEGGYQRQGRWEENQKAIRLTWGRRLCCSTGGADSSVITLPNQWLLKVVTCAHHVWSSFIMYFYLTTLQLSNKMT